MTHVWPWAVPTYSFSVLTGAFYPLVTLALTGWGVKQWPGAFFPLPDPSPTPPHTFTHTPNTARGGGEGGC